MVTINCPLHKSTRGLFDQVMLTNMKQGAYLVNTARGAIVDRDALVKVLESGHLAGVCCLCAQAPLVYMQYCTAGPTMVPHNEARLRIWPWPVLLLL